MGTPKKNPLRASIEPPYFISLLLSQLGLRRPTEFLGIYVWVHKIYLRLLWRNAFNMNWDFGSSRVSSESAESRIYVETEPNHIAWKISSTWFEHMNIDSYVVYESTNQLIAGGNVVVQEKLLNYAAPDLTHFKVVLFFFFHFSSFSFLVLFVILFLQIFIWLRFQHLC